MVVILDENVIVLKSCCVSRRRISVCPGRLLVDAGHHIVHIEYLVLNSCGLQKLCSCHFFTYFPDHFSVNRDIAAQELLTRTASLHLLRSNPKNRKHLYHYFHNDIDRGVRDTFVYISRHWKEFSMRSKMSMSVSWLARTPLAAYERYYDDRREIIIKDSH